MPKQPEDHKTKAEPFVWEGPDGQMVTLKPFSRLPFGLFRKSRDKSDEERTYLLIEAATDEAGLEVVDELELDEVNGMFEDWSKASGVELPES